MWPTTVTDDYFPLFSVTLTSSKTLKSTHRTEFSPNVFTEFSKFNDKIVVKRLFKPATACVRDPRCYHWATKTQVRDRIFTLILIHASVIYQIPRVHSIYLPFRENSNIWIEIPRFRIANQHYSPRVVIEIFRKQTKLTILSRNLCQKWFMLWNRLLYLDLTQQSLVLLIEHSAIQPLRQRWEV